VAAPQWSDDIVNRLKDSNIRGLTKDAAAKLTEDFG
jgi:hypothetical protein